MDPGAASDVGSDPIRVVVIDGDDRSRQMLVNRLQQKADIAVVGEGHSVAGSMAIVQSSAAEVVIADAKLVDGSGDEICRRLRAEDQQCGCVLLTGLPPRPDGPPVVGVDAVVLKEVLGDTLEREVRRVGAAVRSGLGRSAPR